MRFLGLVIMIVLLSAAAGGFRVLPVRDLFSPLYNRMGGGGGGGGGTTKTSFLVHRCRFCDDGMQCNDDDDDDDDDE